MKYEIAPKSTETRLTWEEARMYCFSLNIDGKIGWRLPTKEELNEIYESVNDFEKAWYWSSTENNGNTAWSQGFNGGYRSNGGNKVNGLNYVRAIRSIP
jgi:hypothetical protein